MKNQIGYLLKNCEKCQIYNRKNISKGDFVTTSRPFEKVALDLIDMRKEGMYIMIAIDYFSRFIVTIVIPDKKASIIRAAVEQ